MDAPPLDHTHDVHGSDEVLDKTQKSGKLGSREIVQLENATSSATREEAHSTSQVAMEQFKEAVPTAEKTNAIVHTMTTVQTEATSISYETMSQKEQLLHDIQLLGLKPPKRIGGYTANNIGNLPDFLRELAIRNCYGSIPETTLIKFPELQALAKQYETIASPLRNEWHNQHAHLEKIKRITKKGLEQILLYEKGARPLGFGSSKEAYSIKLYRSAVTPAKTKVLSIIATRCRPDQNKQKKVVHEMEKEHLITKMLRENGVSHILPVRRVDLLSDEDSVEEVALLMDRCETDLREAPTEMREKIRFAREIADGLQGLHDLGNCSHRDLFGRNIFIKKDEHDQSHAFLADFGAASLKTDISELEYTTSKQMDILCFVLLLKGFFHDDVEWSFQIRKFLKNETFDYNLALSKFFPTPLQNTGENEKDKFISFLNWIRQTLIDQTLPSAREVSNKLQELFNYEP